MICSVKPVENSSELQVSAIVRLPGLTYCLTPSASVPDDNTFTNGRQNESSTHMPDITRRYSDSLITRARAFGFH